MLYRGQRFRASKADVAHVADVEDADARANGHVLVDDAAADSGGVFDWHVPAVELHHLCAHPAMDGVQRRFANQRRSGFSSGQRQNLDRIWELFKLTSGREQRQMEKALQIADSGL